MAHQMGPQNKIGVIGRDWMADVRERRLAIEVAALKELVYQQQRMIDWIIKVRKDNQAQRGVVTESQPGKRSTIRDLELVNNTASAVTSSEVLSRGQCCREYHETLQFTSSGVTRSTKSPLIEKWSAARKSRRRNEKTTRISSGHYMSKCVHNDRRWRKTLKIYKFKRGPLLRGDPEVLTIQDNSRMDYDGKILSKGQWIQKAFFKDALKRFTVERKRNCALAGACPRARGRHGDHGAADIAFVDDWRWRENEFAFQFLTSFRVSGSNCQHGNTSKWMKRETHVSFREGEG